LEPKGRFVLLDVRDGHALIDAAVQPEPALADIYVLAMGDQYILVTCRQAGVRNGQESIQPLPGAMPKPVSSGLVYGFDRKGKMLWPAPVKVANTHLVVDEPDRLPIVTFACLAYRRGNSPSGPYSCPVLCIDKRTGHEVFREQIPMPTTVLDITGDPEKHTVQLRLHNVITLTFTDKPWPAGEKTETGSDESSSWGSKILQAIIDSAQASSKEARQPASKNDAKDSQPPASQSAPGNK